MSNEHPILFSTPMVQAILDGRKTMTRRLNGLDKINQSPDSWLLVGTYHILSNDTFEAHFQHKATKEIIEVKCNYGLPTDLLWVRETFWKCKNDGKIIFTANASNKDLSEVSLLKIDGPVFKMKPSIHMPKAAARIWLKITGIKVERLQDITDEDAIKEGVDNKTYSFGIRYKDYAFNDFEYPYPYMSFQSLWISINGRESWNANPWIWAIEFEVLSTTGKPAAL